MSDDPNKKQNEGAGSGGQGSHQSGPKPGQQSDKQNYVRNESPKSPQGGNESDKDHGQKEQGGQRRAS
jgi:hypothetical protein